MPYLTYNLPIQRTGFRPYGHTNPWSATQLSGTPSQRQVFSEPGGRRLGQYQRGFSPMVLHGMGQAACDPTDPLGPCYDPLIYPSSTAPTPAAVPSPDNACAGPNPPLFCASSSFPAESTSWSPYYSSSSAVPVSLSPGSSPRVTVPTATATVSQPVAQSCPAGYGLNTATRTCVPIAQSTWTQLTSSLGTTGMIALFGLAAFLLMSGGKHRR